MRYLLSVFLVLGMAMGAWAGDHPIDPAAGTPVQMAAQTGGDAAAQEWTSTFAVATLSLTEVTAADSTGVFSVTANEVCYSGVPTITVLLEMPVSYIRTITAGIFEVGMSFGKDTTGDIADGDELSELYSNNTLGVGNTAFGAVAEVTTLDTADCISLLVKSSGSGTYQITGGVLRITQL